MGLRTMQKAIAAVAALFLLCACVTKAQTPPDKTQVQMEFPVPSILRQAKYPCWTGNELHEQIRKFGMTIVHRGLVSKNIDPSQPLVEIFQNEEHFAILIVYPNHQVVCSMLVGESLDGA